MTNPFPAKSYLVFWFFMNTDDYTKMYKYIERIQKLYCLLNDINKKKKQSYFKGYFAEFIAICFLKLKGYKILSHRYKTYVGEIDIIAVRGNRLAFIEVKSRKNKIDGLTAISKKQSRRNINASSIWLSKNIYYNSFTINYDLIIVSKILKITHIKNFYRCK